MSKLGTLAAFLLVPILGVHLLTAADAVVQPSLASKNPSAIQVTLSMDRTSYRLGGDPHVSILVRNVSANPVLIANKGAVVDVWLVIVDPAGHELAEDPTMPLHALPYGGLGTVIRPGATFVETADKADVGPFFPLSYWGYRLTVPGTYRITARYRSSGTQSNTVNFTVGS